ncbi:MAG: SAM-dependent methyltransferase, partial [Proteobacteria bacterium]|nr:SAM-dependent methyltransferase [Pseudomonadota bacterium]
MTETLCESPETRFIGLMSELFQLREAEELDFGIYRVIRRHNQKVREFLGEIVEDHGQPVLRGGELAGILEGAFQHIGQETRNEKKLELQRMAEALGIKAHLSADEREKYLLGVEKIPAMRQQVMDYRNLREELETTYSASADRSEVLNRLYEFFSRHYQDGDFIVQRRYGRNGARYIRSSGEDTEFHWATEDMYYIKSGDVFTDYPVCLSNGQRLVFCVDAETLKQTRAELKPTDKASYKLRTIVQDSPRPLGEGPGVRVRVILDYVKGAQKARAQLEEIASKAASIARVQPEEIARHLRRYVARNQSDFFIHKRLQEALDDDLDIFVKTDVLNAEQLLADEAGQLPARALRVARGIR